MRRRLGALLLLTALGACNDPHAPAQSESAAFVERVLPPRQATPAERSPLLVLLHGIGSDESDLLPVARQLDPRFTVASLRAPRPYHSGFAWFHIDWGPGRTVTANVDQARATLADLVRWLEDAPQRLGTDPSRTYLLGFSQGGMMSLGALRAAPDRLAGVVVLSGRRSDDLFAAPTAPGSVARVPLFVAHGVRDEVLPIADGRAIRDGLQPLVEDFTYREYAIPHVIDGEEIRAVGTWLTERLDRPR